jgi:hypothetical protein
VTDLPGGPWPRGSSPGIYGRPISRCRGSWVPTDQVRGLKAHGPRPAKTAQTEATWVAMAVDCDNHTIAYLLSCKWKGAEVGEQSKAGHRIEEVILLFGEISCRFLVFCATEIHPFN